MTCNILYYSLYYFFFQFLFHWQNWKVHSGPDVLTVFFVYYLLQLCSVPVTLLNVCIIYVCSIFSVCVKHVFCVGFVDEIVLAPNIETPYQTKMSQENTSYAIEIGTSHK